MHINYVLNVKMIESTKDFETRINFFSFVRNISNLLCNLIN